MKEVGKARKAGDRRRVRANRVVDTSHTGAAPRTKVFRVGGRTAEFNTGMGSKGKNGRA